MLFSCQKKSSYTLEQIRALDGAAYTNLFRSSVRSGDIATLSLFFTNGMSGHLETPDGRTPLIVAVSRGHTEAAALLLAHGARINDVGFYAQTPLLRALDAKKVDAALLLIRHGADVNRAMFNGWTPLHFAIKENMPDVVRQLIVRGADANAATKSGFTPIMIAARNGESEMLALLLTAKPDVNRRSPDGWTAARLALRYHHPAIVRLLLAHGALTNEANEAREAPSETTANVKKNKGPWSYTIRKAQGDATLITLGYNDGFFSRNSMSITIIPEIGGKIISWRVGGRELLRSTTDAALLHGDELYGIPVMYPTPNRIKNGEYLWNGKRRHMQFPDEGRPRELHGLVWDDLWVSSLPEISADGVSVMLRYDIDENNPRFRAFPWRNTLRMRYRLMTNGIRFEYEVTNRDRAAFGYGLGLHPIFAVRERKDVTVSVDVSTMLKVDKNFFPLGGIEMATNAYLLALPRPLTEIELQAPYFPVSSKNSAVISYRGGPPLILSASDDFRHLVVWNPRMKNWYRNFFSVENQTCSSDVHNYHASGRTAEAALIVIEPGASRQGYVEYRIDRNTTK